MEIDSLLPSILKHSIICKIENEKFYIHDRRKYPFENTYVECLNIEEIASAIKNMVTQGGGPLDVCLEAMYYLSLFKNVSLNDYKEAIEILSNSRPTNTTMKEVLEGFFIKIKDMFKSNTFSSKKVREEVDAILNSFNEKYLKMAKTGESLIKDGDGILTTCFPEHSTLLSIKLAINNGKKVVLYVPETRPYLQGARLTAPSARELGIPITLITDNMVANLMRDKKINIYLTASDYYTKEGAIVNKIGTLQNAISANYYNIPYYAFSLKSRIYNKSKNEVVIEYRDPKEVKQIRGIDITSSNVDALYPCFDIVDEELVAGVITPEKIEKN